MRQGCGNLIYNLNLKLPVQTCKWGELHRIHVIRVLWRHLQQGAHDGLFVLATRILLTVRPADANEDTLFYVGTACRAIGRDDNCRNGIDYKGGFARVNLTSNLEASHSFR